jgi:hypothetical protein
MVDVEKAESHERLAVPTSNEIGQPRIITSSSFIQDKRKAELAMPQRLYTFDCMAEDDSVYQSIDVTNLHVANALHGGEFVSPSGTSSSKLAAEFLNYCIRNMSQGTWLDAINNAVTDLQYGYSLLNLVTERKVGGEFAGSVGIKKLAPRDQKSVYGWLWDKEFRELKGFVQKPPLKQSGSFNRNSYVSGGLAELSTGKYYDGKYPIIRNNQMLHFKYNSKNNNPQGDSPLLHCYNALMEKKLVEKYEVVGVSKDLGGALVLKVPSELITRANNPTQYPNEAKEYKDLQNDAAKLHAGESSYIVLTSDVDDTTKTPLYDMTFQGIEGGGKQYNTSDIIKQKRTSIYNVFGAGFILLGQDAQGSYALSTGANSTHGYYVERNIAQKVDVLNHQLAPRLLAANNVYLNHKDMPVYKPVDPQEADLDVISKFVQRTGSVQLLTPQALEFLYEKGGLPLDGIEDLDFTDKGESRAGESLGTSGTGNSQGKQDSSTANNENAATKNMVIDYETEDEVVAIDTNTGEPMFIQKEK